MNIDQDIFFPFFALIIFLFYWIFGGVFFAILALLRLRRIYKVRFSCLFTFTSIGCALAATWTGKYWIQNPESVCVQRAVSLINPFVSFFTCSFFTFIVAVLVWAIVLVVIGSLFLLVSRTDEETWLGHILHLIKKSSSSEDEEI
ncbi:hypothetical protein CO172_03560 [Candidatus Uhrbacteria bacterium CG_4_9_14_3_um_filter_36_7]|uniref:Uncharacterized protein n=1 Tax=Candidatus Uhrbacteria bacterium CG_4_9_14_3_um_filter_36_7 TaxID=1975033 RepID=A0A2M7XFZ0_9BACT|nr:MAG: hypothetical protein CO172_03560 [Candidatus Uhrbacteria bacterium CG_4_9_14_3_um_filter_36_7]